MFVRAKALGCALIVAATVAITPAAQAAVMLSDFDTTTHYAGTGGWFNYGGIVSIGSVAAPTGGASNWLALGPYQYGSKTTAQSWASPNVSIADWNANKAIEFDVIIPGLPNPSAWVANNPAQNITAEMQVGGGITGETNKYASTTIDTNLKDTSFHVVMDYSSLGASPFDGTGTYWNLSLMNFHPGYDWGWDPANIWTGVPYAANIYIDNIQFTPEPASLSVLGLGMILLGRRRK